MQSILLDPLLLSFSPIQLSELSSNLKLMNRVDTKYLTTEAHLLKLLPLLISTYNIQEVSKVRNSRYKTLYFDTKDLSMYFMHHNNKGIRYKIRIREYEESNSKFFEIKKKDRQKRTSKQRIQIEDYNIYDNIEVIQFLKENVNYKINELFPVLRNRFNRITLINKEMTERLTIDTNINFENINNEITASIPNIVIIELKQLINEPSYSKYLFKNKELKIYMNSISKYCTGSILTNNTLKHNAFKNKIKFLNKLSKN